MLDRENSSVSVDVQCMDSVRPTRSVQCAAKVKELHSSIKFGIEIHLARCGKNVFVSAGVEIEADSVQLERVAPFNVNNSINCGSSSGT